MLTVDHEVFHKCSDLSRVMHPSCVHQPDPGVRPVRPGLGSQRVFGRAQGQNPTPKLKYQHFQHWPAFGCLHKEGIARTGFEKLFTTENL